MSHLFARPVGRRGYRTAPFGSGDILKGTSVKSHDAVSFRLEFGGRKGEKGAVTHHALHDACAPPGAGSEAPAGLLRRLQPEEKGDAGFRFVEVPDSGRNQQSGKCYKLCPAVGNPKKMKQPARHRSGRYLRYLTALNPYCNSILILGHFRVLHTRCSFLLVGSMGSYL